MASLSVLNGAVSCYLVSVVNFIWFTDDKCSLCQHYSTWGHEMRCLFIQKTQPSRKRCVLVHCLAGRCRSQAITTMCESDRFGHFCGCSGKTSTICRLL